MVSAFYVHQCIGVAQIITYNMNFITIMCPSHPAPLDISRVPHHLLKSSITLFFPPLSLVFHLSLVVLTQIHYQNSSECKGFSKAFSSAFHSAEASSGWQWGFQNLHFRALYLQTPYSVCTMFQILPSPLKSNWFTNLGHQWLG